VHVGVRRGALPNLYAIVTPCSGSYVGEARLWAVGFLRQRPDFAQSWIETSDTSPQVILTFFAADSVD